MPQASETGGLRPVVPFLKIPDKGSAYLEGTRCPSCQAVFVGERSICAQCGARDGLRTIRLSDRGELYVFSVVYRSFPGVDVPYVSAVVDLEGGGTLKGNLVDVEPDPAKIRMGMPIEVVYRKAPRADSEGHEYLTYYFRPRA